MVDEKTFFRQTEINESTEETNCYLAAVSCSLSVPRLGGVKFGFWLTGKLGRAWVGAWVGAWRGAWVQ